MHDDGNNPAAPARIRSFVRREGRLTVGQKQALARLLPIFGLPLQPAQYLELSRLFAHDLPVVLEIGFGNGESLLAQAVNDQQQNYIGLEVHRPGAGHLLMEIERLQLDNIRIAVVDAAQWLPLALAAASIAGIQIFFPDPWHKKRHRKRRLLQLPFVDELVRILQPGGSLMLATDWQDYAGHMLACLDAHQRLDNSAGAGHYSPRPDSRPLTRFERRGQRLGHEVFDLHYTRAGG